jgi:SHAQKYF class myb-like DNA-binding protein
MQLAALSMVAPPPRAPERAVAPKPPTGPASRAPRPAPAATQPPAARGGNSPRELYPAAVEDEREAGPAGEGRRPWRRKRARLDPSEFVTQHLGPGPAPGATSSDGTAPKGRLKWTNELKSAFDSAVESLGGLVHAQPAQILVTMRVSNGGVPPSLTTTDSQVIVLSLNHLKSYLQKKRLVAITNGTLDPADIGAGRGITHVRRTSKAGAQEAARVGEEETDALGDGEQGGAAHQLGENGGGGAELRRRGAAAGHTATNGAHGAGKASAHRASRPIPDSAARLLALLAATGPDDEPDETANGRRA